MLDSKYLNTRFMKAFIPVLLLCSSVLGAVGALPSSVVDWNDARQQIDGFGGGVVFLNPASLDPVTAANTPIGGAGKGVAVRTSGRTANAIR